MVALRSLTLSHLHPPPSRQSTKIVQEHPDEASKPTLNTKPHEIVFSAGITCSRTCSVQPERCSAEKSIRETKMINHDCVVVQSQLRHTSEHQQIIKILVYNCACEELCKLKAFVKKHLFFQVFLLFEKK